MRKLGERILSAALAFILIICMEITASATAPEGELTEEQKLQQELDAAYAMTVQSNSIPGWPQGPGTYGDAAIVMEVETGAILYSKNIKDHHFPASITKVLTALVAMENGQFVDPVVFSHDSLAFIQPGDAYIGMKEGNQITLEQGLYATLLASANEVAYAVAENVGKNAGYDYNWFIERMNARCRELGGENSNFANPHGLHDPNHYTCAKDMALIGREIFRHPEFFNIVQTLQYTIPASETTEEHIFQQKHKMLYPANAEYYEWAVGGKTGYTSEALSTLITMADNGNMQLVCVVLRTHGRNVYPDTRNLLDYAFSNFTRIPAAEVETSEDVEQILSTPDNTDPAVGKGYVIVPNGMEFKDLAMEIVPDSENAGEGTIEYRYSSTLLGTARAVLSQSYIDSRQKDTKGREPDQKPDEKKKDKDDQLLSFLSDKTDLEKYVIFGGAVVLLILTAVLITIIRRRKKR